MVLDRGQGVAWGAGRGAMVDAVRAADFLAPAASASKAATTMGDRSTTISIAVRSLLASTSRHGIATERFVSFRAGRRRVC
jgi:hypothetical protein